MKVGVVGGTFDPFHQGHKALIQAAWQHCNLDRMLIIPVGISPLKERRILPMSYRYYMCQLGLQNLVYAEVSTLEIFRETKAYTLDTVNALKAMSNQQDEIVLIFGSDILYEIEQWHKPAKLFKACRFLLAVRSGDNLKKANAKKVELVDKYQAQIDFFPMPEVDASSTAIRTQIDAAHNWEVALPKKVSQYIETQGIYRFNKDLSFISAKCWQRIQTIERYLWPILTQERLLHVLNVMQYAVHLAHIYQVDVDQIALAALLHDAAKCLPLTEQYELAKKAKKMKNVAFPDDKSSYQTKELAHGPAGAFLAKEKFGVDDPEILRAIYYHTTYHKKLTELGKILYLADKIELGRQYGDLTDIRLAAEENLDKAVLLCLDAIKKVMKLQNRALHPLTQDALSFLKN